MPQELNAKGISQNSIYTLILSKDIFVSVYIQSKCILFFLHKTIQKGTLSTSGKWDGRRTGSEDFYCTFMIFGRSWYFTSVTSDWTCPDWVRCSSFLLHSILHNLWSTAASQRVLIVCYLSIRATTYKLFEGEIYFCTLNWYLTYNRNCFYILEIQQISTNMNNWIEFSMTINPGALFQEWKWSVWQEKVLKALKFSFFRYVPR